MEKPLVRQRKVTPRSGVALAVIAGILIILGVVDAILLFNFSLNEMLILALVLVIIYAIILFFSLQPRVIREIRHAPQVIRQPISSVKEVETPVFVEVEPKINTHPSQKYDYIGSVSTQTYHKRNCRLAKSIKAKYKLSDNNKSFFVKQKFKACKVCMPVAKKKKTIKIKKKKVVKRKK